MLLRPIRRILAPGFLLLCFVPAAWAQSVAGPQGGSYVIQTSADQIASVSNDDGTVVQYQYDSEGAETGLNVSVGDVSLSLQYAISHP
jgi:hypothetical protein